MSNDLSGADGYWGVRGEYGSGITRSVRTTVTAGILMGDTTV